MRDLINVKSKNRPQSFWVFIKDSKPHPIGLAPLKEYHELFHPFLETGFTYPISMMWNVSQNSMENSLDLLMTYYKDLVNAKLYEPGPHGDWIKCSLLRIEKEKYLNLDIIGQAAWGDDYCEEFETQNIEYEEKVGTRVLWMFIKNSTPHPLGLAPIRDYKENLSPILETKHTFPLSMCWRITNQTKAKTEELILSYYMELVNSKILFPGPYGDWVKCSQLVIGSRKEKYINLDLIGSAAWEKVTLAADLGIFVKNLNQIFFIGVIRKNDPGKGEPAIIGGIRNINLELDSAAYTMLKESKEETNFTIKYKGNVEELKTNYNIQKIPVIVQGFEIINPNFVEIHSHMHFITSIPTPEQERLPDGRKRVYETSCYVILVDVAETPLSVENLLKVFQAGDDALEIYLRDVTDCFQQENSNSLPVFGLHHHKGLFIEMVNFLKNYYHL